MINCNLQSNLLAEFKVAVADAVPKRGGAVKSLR